MVVRVVDGDTLIVKLQGKDERVRLIGIDTPESVKPDTPVQCFGTEASDRMKALLPAGTAVRMERDKELRDRFQRLLAYVYRTSDGLFVNLSMIEGGFAVADPIAPNKAHAAEIATAAAAARKANRGMYGRCGNDIPHHALQ